MKNSKNVSLRAKIKHYWLWVKKILNVLSSSFWFIPSILIIIATVAAINLENVVVQAEQFPQYLGWLETKSASTSLQMLQIIASSVITVTSIAFSMTLVALTMASSQFGPRLLGRFMQDKRTQAVLGVFTATFIYCLMVIGQISIDEDSIIINPVTSVAIAKLLAISCVFVLIYFIHHVAVSISADHVIETVHVKMMEDIATFQNVHEQFRLEEKLSCENSLAGSHQPLENRQNGYLQAIDYNGIAEVAQKMDMLVEINVHAGNYLIPGQKIAVCIHNETGDVTVDINQFMVVGSKRTSLQDPVFAINQLVEMTLRALSPSLNDPFTAINCINRISTAFCSFTRVNAPKRLIVDNQKKARVHTDEPTLEHIFDTTFDKIRQASHNDISVIKHLLKTFTKILNVKDQDRMLHASIKRQAEIIQYIIQGQPFTPQDQTSLNKLIETIFEATEPTR